MQIVTKETEGKLIVAVSGRLDTVTCSDFEKSCLELVEEGSKALIIDFSGLEYISSAGLRSILVVGKKLKSSGRVLSLCGLSGLVQEVFSMSGFDNFFPVYATVEDAVR